MSNYTVEAKSQLAKLMATENISVRHQKIRTAKFDVRNRILHLPIWKDMDGYMYDLLTGHEVGHALYTPLDGWHDVVIDKNKGLGYKFFLNVVEDARIEKKIQRRYPGLRKCFIKAYDELFDRDFFDIKNKNINTKPFIDRLNIFTKSQYTLNNIEFTEDEYEFVLRTKNLETWEDVVALTDEIYDYSKEEQKKLYQEINQDGFFGSHYDENDDEDYLDEDNYFEDDGEIDDFETSENEDDAETEFEDGDLQHIEGDEVTEDETEKSEENFDEKFQPTCLTDEAHRKNEASLLDDMSKEYVYLTLPKPNLKKIIVPAKRVQEQLTDFYKKRYSPETIQKKVDKFKSKNDRYVGLLVKEFEMKKAAKEFSKSKLSETGDIDVSKLCNYKFDDNIFRKTLIKYNAKSHGLVLLLDGSGSMQDNMEGSIEQVLVISMFCRKVNIPFVVYSFNNSPRAMRNDSELDTYVATGCFESGDNTIELKDFRLREYLNSKMNNAEFNNCVKNMVCLMDSYGLKNWNTRPASEDLAGTPLNSAIVAIADVIDNFKKNNNLDLVNLVLVHDGDSDTSYHYKTKEYVNKAFDMNNQNVILSDKKIKYQRKLKPNAKSYNSPIVTGALLDWCSRKTGAHVVGFYIMQPRRTAISAGLYKKYTFPNMDTFESLRWDKCNGDVYHEDITIPLNKLVENMKNDSFVSSSNFGYTNFFFVKGGKEMMAEGNELQVSGDVTAAKIKRAFMKMNKKRQVSRVLVTKFIDTIAKGD